MKKVLLTGISGYIGLHCASELLKEGFSVRGTVRNAAKRAEVSETLTSSSMDLSNLEMVEVDLTSENGWFDAASGCDYLMHVASPFTIANPKSENEMIEPAVQGTLRVLQAANQANIKRVILTSSIVAMMGDKKNGTFTPEDWTDVSTKDVSTYAKSKTLAERAAWDFVKHGTDQNKFELVVLNPGGVFGPPLGKNMEGQSLAVLAQMLSGKQPVVPNVAFTMVDVSDVAKIHVQALTHPEAANHRFILSGTIPQSFANGAKILKEAQYKGPSTLVAPDFLIKIMSVFDREAKGLLGFLGSSVHADNSKTIEMFDWEPIPFEKSILESAAVVKTLLN